MTALVRILFVLCLTWTGSRLAVYALPGDPADYLVHETLVQISPEEIRTQMYLPHSAWLRVFHWPNSKSLISHLPTQQLITEALFNSAMLATLSLLLTLAITLGALFLEFKHPAYRSCFDHLSALFSAFPLMILGPILILIFCVRLRWLPPSGNPLLPALALALSLSAFWYRHLSQNLRNFERQSPLVGYLARGESDWSSFSRALLAPSAGAFAAYFGTQLGFLLNGSLITEIIFSWRGLGSLLSDAVQSRDYPVIEMSLFVACLITLIAQQFGYWLQSRWDPRAP